MIRLNTQNSAATIFLDNQCEDITISGVGGVDRGINMGNGLDRMFRGKRLRIVIPPGHRRPLDKQIAAMYATACSIAVKEVVPVLLHWKRYKKRNDIFKAFAGHVAVSFVTLESSSIHFCS